jgi:serine/threonine-protein kinase
MKVCPTCGKEYSDTSTLCPIDAGVLQNLKDPLLEQTLAGKYVIEELIKHGGMGAVYRGRHILMEKRVAIKVLRPSLAVDDDVVARFSREAKAASRISHPHAVSVTDFGESENGVVFLVMEYLEGRTLKEVIKSEGPLALNRVAEIARQVAGALDAAHEQGVIHRDLKSDNIMLSQTSSGEWAKVLDFGIAKIQQVDGIDDLTAPNLVIGTPQYMSPEQCSHSGPLDARSDVYSFGIIVYEMLAGKVPFTGESPTIIMMQQVQDDPPSILEARPGLPPAFANVIEKALKKKPEDRFQTAGELSKAIFEAAQIAAVSGDLLAAPATVPNVPVAPAIDDEDEETVVRARAPEVIAVQPHRDPLPYQSRAIEPQPPVGLNPWRIMVPAAIALVAVFGLVFFLTRSTGQTPGVSNSGVTQPGLVPDPNSQPVQSAGTPTGESERNIQPQPSAPASPTPRANNNLNSNQNIQEIPSTVTGNFGENSNSGRRNANQRSSPTPMVPESEDTPPPRPKASPSSRPAAKPTATPDQ